MAMSFNVVLKEKSMTEDEMQQLCMLAKQRSSKNLLATLRRGLALGMRAGGGEERTASPLQTPQRGMPSPAAGGGQPQELPYIIPLSVLTAAPSTGPSPTQ